MEHNLQAYNLQQVVDILFPRTAAQAQMNAFRGENLYDRKKAILEPSFVCEALGIQGRVDLMTMDLAASSLVAGLSPIM